MNVPEIRFKEFCDYYSDVLLEKCLSVSNKKNNKLEYKKEDALSVSDEFGVVNQIEHLGRSYTGNNISTYGEFYQFNLSSCIRQQNSLTAQFVSFSLSNLANIFYPPPIFTIINLCLL